MRQRLDSWAAGMVLAGLLTAAAGAQSLGDYARQQRAQKPATPATKVYTNDNLSTSGGLSDARAASAPAATSEGAASKDEGKPEDSGKQAEEYRARAKEIKDKISTLEHEIQVRKDELNWRPLTAALQYDKRIADDDQKRRSEIADKEKELAAERQKLEDLRDELRRKDLPRSWAD